MLVILGLGQGIGPGNTSVSKSKRSSQPDNVRRSTLNGLLGESSEPWSNRVLFVGRDCLSNLKREKRLENRSNHLHYIAFPSKNFSNADPSHEHSSRNNETHLSLSRSLLGPPLRHGKFDIGPSGAHKGS